MVKGWNLIIDVAKCDGCYNCVLATKDEHIGNEFPGYAAPEPAQGHHWIRIERKVRGSAPMVDVAYLPTMCNHCDAAPCVKAANGPAITKRHDGIVLISPEHAKGRRDLVESCPYGAIWWNEELQLPQKWTFDAHLLDNGWKTTRGAQACPTVAMRVLSVDEAQMKALIEQENLEVLEPEKGTLPRVYYKSLHRFQRAFIAGKVLAGNNGTVDCVERARVVLKQGSREIAHTETDVFGEFKFDGLKCDSGTYTLIASREGDGSARCTAQLGESVYLGTMMLGPAPSPSAA
jgi:Fe-S-cluster-containing dehydrogenase component